MDKVIATKARKPKLPPVVVEPVWLDVQSRSFRVYTDTERNESVLIEHVANSVTYRMWISIIKAPGRVDRYWRDHSGNEPTPANVTEFLTRSGELRQTAQIMVRPKGKYFEIVGIKPARALQ